MREFVLRIILQSETILGCGQSVPGVVDLDVQYDEYGLIVFKGKTIKGIMRENAENLVQLAKKINANTKIGEKVDKLFGDANNYYDFTLKFSDCLIAKNVRKALTKGIQDRKITKNQIIDAMTEIRSFTSINEKGTSKNQSLRKIRVIKPDIVIESTISVDRNLSDDELILLAATVKNINRIGSLTNRGKGKVECKLFEDNRNITVSFAEKFLEVI
ncbi:MAG: RAMP superfamily CRISPR-associated protein [Alkaliphilus sp.]